MVLKSEKIVDLKQTKMHIFAIVNAEITMLRQWTL